MAEFFCSIFGHTWNLHGSETDTETGIIKHEWYRCEECGMEKHDRSGYLKLDKLKYGSK